uniref:PIPK domain-containing protein n=1 Tax=Haemonchus placei TaxID=6290 RepID=A0A0N4WZ61_HAEPC
LHDSQKVDPTFIEHEQSTEFPDFGLVSVQSLGQILSGKSTLSFFIAFTAFLKRIKLDYFRDPPTYATRFHKLRFADCVAPGSLNASRRSYMRYDDMIGSN